VDVPLFVFAPQVYNGEGVKRKKKMTFSTYPPSLLPLPREGGIGER
jgi:hypothetical protein